jgi:predicted outer membrane repeat protein
MKLRNAVILTLFICLLIIGSVSASEDSLQNNLTVQTPDSDIREMSVPQDTQNPFPDDEFILGQAASSDDDIQAKSSQDSGDVFKSEMAGNALAATDNEIKAAQDWKTFEVSDYKTLHSALTTGEHDKVIINVNSNIVLKNTNIVSDSIKKLIINGNGKTIDGNKKYHLVTRGDVTLKNIRMVNCYSSFGGAIKNEGKLEIINSKFEKNKAKYGAAIDNGRNLIIKNCIFNKNTATRSGGAICNSGTLKIVKSTIKNNKAKDAGAIINDKKLQIIGCKITGNKGAVGAINNGGTLKITDTTIKSNKAGHVGIISNYKGKLSMSNSKIINNKAATKKGGYVISSDKAKATIKHCTINSNSGLSSIYNDGTMSIDKTSISYNKAKVDTINTMNGKLTIRNSVLNKNFAKSGGGAITNYNSKVTLVKCTINKNKANKEGGAIYNGARLIISHCKINKNKALKGGGAICNHGKITIKNSKLLYNKPGGAKTIKNFNNGKTKRIKTKIR